MRAKDVLGRRGEELAAGYLESLGMRVVDRNWRCAEGEIDIVAWDGPVLAFVEVKTRRSIAAWSVPAEAVDYRKRRQLLVLAQAYASREGLHEAPWRFDVVEVSGPPGAQRLRLMKNAFDANDV